MSLGMRLVFLDTQSAPAGLDFAPLKQLGELITYESTKPLESFHRVEGCDVVITVGVPISRPLLDWAPRVRQIVVLSPSPDLVDMQAAGDLGVKVSVLGSDPNLAERAAAAIRGAGE